MLARYYIAQLDKELNKVPQLIQLEAATGVPKTYVVLGAGSFVALMIFFNIAGQLFSNLLGFAYPAYRSFKALESPEKDDDKQWYVFSHLLVLFPILIFLSFGLEDHCHFKDKIRRLRVFTRKMKVEEEEEGGPLFLLLCSFPSPSQTRGRGEYYHRLWILIMSYTPYMNILQVDLLDRLRIRLHHRVLHRLLVVLVPLLLLPQDRLPSLAHGPLLQRKLSRVD